MPPFRSFLISLVALSLLAATSAQDGDLGGSEALERLANCARDRDQLTVMVLMDESGSLPRTDPDAQRVAAAQLGLRTLVRLGQDLDVQVVVSIAGFAVDFEMVRPWTELDDSSMAVLLQDLDSFRDRTTGLDTDFAAAFVGARDEFARHAATTQNETCELLLLFTDGDYDIEERDTNHTDERRREGLEKPYAPGLRLDQPGVAAEVEALGRELLCSPDGVLDELRGDDVVVITVALEDEISVADRAFLQAISAGQSDGTTCGSRIGDQFGAYLPANDLTELIWAFGSIANEVGGGTRKPEREQFPVCPQERCAAGTLPFELSPAYEQFQLLANSGAPEVILELSSPEIDAPLVLRSGEIGTYQLGSVTLDVVWLSPVDVAIDGSLPAGEEGWHGTWEMTFIDPTGLLAGAVASAQLYLFGGLTPELVEDPGFRMGDEAAIEIRIVDSVGAPRTPAGFVEEARVTAEIADPVSGRVQELEVEGDPASGRYFATWAVPSSIEASSVNLALRLDVIARTGVALQPRIRTYPLPLLPPVDYPHVRLADERLQAITGREGVATGTVLVTGGDASSGCVWIESSMIARLPRNASDVETGLDPDASTQPDCIEVAPSETREIALTVHVGQVASGSAEGRLVARLRSDASPEVLTAELPFDFDMHRPVDEGLRILLMTVLLLVGFLLPMVVLWVLNWWGARFESLAQLRTAAVPVRISPEGRLARIDGGQERPLRFEAADFEYTGGPDAPTREAVVDGVRLQPKVPLFPLRPAFGLAEEDGIPVVGSEGLATDGQRLRGKVPFSLARQWLFKLSEATPSEGGQPEIRGTLRTFLPEGPMERQIGDLIDVLASTVPSAAQTLARQALLQRSTPADTAAAAPDSRVDAADSEGDAWTPPGPGAKRPASPERPQDNSSRDAGSHDTRRGTDRPNRGSTSSHSPEREIPEGDRDGWQPPPR